MITSDPIVSEYASHIERSLARAAEELGPEEFKGVIGDPGLSVLRTAMDYINADFISIWFANQDRSSSLGAVNSHLSGIRRAMSLFTHA